MPTDLLSFLFALIAALSTPCEWEDSFSCYWDADTRGNDIGQSFVIGPETATNEPAWIFYID